MEEMLITFIIPVALMILIFYLLLIRPQQKRQRERNEMLASLQKGDKVVTVGGIHGTIVEITEDSLVLKVADDVRLKFDRAAVNNIDK